MPVDVLLGLQWGDEGKGKIVDVLAPNYHIVARFQGGPNAGHTIMLDNTKIVLHTIPSGIAFDHVLNILGIGTVIDPLIFQKEIEQLKEHNIDPTNRLIISNKAHIIFPTHKLLDITNEIINEKYSIGSTRKGIAPAYADKFARRGLRIHHILESNFIQMFEQKESEHIAILKTLSIDYNEILIDNYTYEEYRQKWLQSIDFLRHFQIQCVEEILIKALDEKKNILAEGAQGSLLDVDFGTYPFITSSNTTIGGAITGLGIPPQQIRKAYGIIKAYNTRVGNGPFPTELFDETGNKIREIGNEYGSTTGRSRRCGWLDLPLLSYAVKRNGITDLIITKIDVLNTFEKIKVCIQYQKNDSNCNDLVNLHKNNPVYMEFDGWETNISECSTYEQLPIKCKKYIEFIESYLKIPVLLISNGPKRKQVIFVKN